jgi:hypothetical protein
VVAGGILFGLARGAVLLALALTRSDSSSLSPAPLEVEVGGCDMVRAPASAGRGPLACEVWGPSFYEPARGAAEEGVLTLWVRTAPGDDPVVSVDGEWVKPRSSRSLPGRIPSAGDERRLQIPVEKGARELVVSAGDGPRRSVFRLALTTAPDSDDVRDLRRAMKAYTSGRRDEARELAERLRQSGSDAVRAGALGILARVAAFAGVPGWPDRFEDAIAADRRAGLVAGEVIDTVIEAYQVMFRAEDPGRAAALLDALDRGGALRDVPEGRAMEPHYRAHLAMRRGDLGEARRLAAASEELSIRLDLRGHLFGVYQEEMRMLDDLGIRGAEVNDLLGNLERSAPGAGQPRQLAEYHQNLGVHQLHAAGPGAEHDAERAAADVHFERALEIFGPGGAWSDGCMERNTVAGRAQAALDLARSGDAERHLGDAARLLEGRVRCEAPPAHLVATWNILAGRLALARGQLDEAERSFDEALVRSRAAALPDHEVAATLGKAEAVQAAGRDGLPLFREAYERLDRWSALVPFGAGKQSFLGGRDGGVRRYLDLLLQQAEREPRGSAERALRVRRLACAARSAMARPLSRAAWSYREARARGDRRWAAAKADYERRRAELSAEVERIGADADEAVRTKKLSDLAAQAADAATTFDAEATRIAGDPPASACKDGSSGPTEPAEGEAILVLHPVREGQWLALGLTPARAVARRVPVAPAELDRASDAIPASLAAELLAPLSELLDEEPGSIARVRIFAADPLGSTDLHELGFPGRPTEPAPSSGAKLGERFPVSYGVDVSGPAAGPAQRALIVVPDLRVPSAAADADAVERALRGAGLEVTVLRGPQATRAAVLAELGRGGLAVLHFFGHGRAEGRDGWASGLLLHGGDRLTVFDVMALDHAPRLVVLASCEAAATEGRTAVQGPTLAHAFLFAGAAHVLGSPRRIDAADTDDIVRELYGRHLSALLADPTKAVHDALLALRDVTSRPDLRNARLPMFHVLGR